MNIEDLIREANPVPACALDAADSPHAQRVLARILQDDSDLAAGHEGRLAQRSRPRSRRFRKRSLIVAGLAAALAGATAAVLVVAGPGPSHRAPPAAGRAPNGPAAPNGHQPAGELTSARQVLLTAAAHVASGPATGKYWRLQAIAGKTWPGGTKAHPYDISVSVRYDQWNPTAAGQKQWDVFNERATVPATPADAAEWRAAGSPATWHSGQRMSRDNFAAGPYHVQLSTSTTASAPGATWQAGNGIVGYVEGDEAGLTAAQFRQLPTSVAGVRALLRHDYAALPVCAKHPSQCSSEDQIVWAEALALLQDPVSAQVRSATFKVMAALPGVRSLGLMTDPLGRQGYGLDAGPLEPTDDSSHPEQVVIIDPGSGALLATEDLAPMPRSVRCQLVIEGGTCVGSAFIGRSYPGQVDDYVALVSASWTDASPVLPPSSAWTTLGSLPGDPTSASAPCGLEGCPF